MTMVRAFLLGATLFAIGSARGSSRFFAVGPSMVRPQSRLARSERGLDAGAGQVLNGGDGADRGGSGPPFQEWMRRPGRVAGPGDLGDPSSTMATRLVHVARMLRSFSAGRPLGTSLSARRNPVETVGIAARAVAASSQRDPEQRPCRGPHACRRPSTATVWLAV